jgi:hypothetical protein
VLRHATQLKGEKLMSPDQHVGSMIDEICKQLGMPKRVFEGSERHDLPSVQYLRELEAREAELKKRFQEGVTKPLVEKFLEQAFPERFWEVVYVFSPGTKLLRRRKDAGLKIDWDSLEGSRWPQTSAT